MKKPERAPPAEVPEEMGFRFQHGPVATSLRDFANALAQAPTSVVHYHRAHYPPWVRDVLGDEPLARRLEQFAQESPAPDVYRDIVVSLVARRAADAAGPT